MLILERDIKEALALRIVAGEGWGRGTIKPYTGKRTIRAIKCALTRERCNGDRWARIDILRADGADWQRLDLY